MRRWPTWLVVGALVALGAVAAADALRGEEKRIVPTRSSSSPAAAATAVERPAMSGALYYSDARDGCRLSGLTLPDLGNPAFDPSTGAPPKLRSCRFSLSPDGGAAVAGQASWSPGGGLYAREQGGEIELVSRGSGRTLRFPGRAPAFKPDGTFTFVRDGAIVEWATDCPPESRLFTFPGDNATARCPERFASLEDDAASALAWLSDERVAVIVQPSEYELLIIERGRIRARVPGWGRPISDLRVSPRGTYVAVRAEGRGGWLVFRRDGSSVALPALTSIRAITWSPDERWTAVATVHSIFVFRTDREEARIRRLPVEARDLAWR